ncbi:MAG: tetratricopeptide repeat protein [Reichenbachiella sp.]
MRNMQVLAIFYSCLPIENAERSVVKYIEEDTVEVVDYSIQEYSAISMQGDKLYAPGLSSRDKAKRENQLSESLEDFNSNPDSLSYIIWFGRRLSNLFLFKEAIKVYTDGIEKFPESYELYRHRGESFLTIREFDNAIMDLEKAAFYVRNVPIIMEEGSARNRRNIPRVSIQFNIWYQLGYSYFLKGNYDKAISGFKKCLNLSNNDDMLVLATDCLYMTYRRLGNLETATELLEPIQRRMNVIEHRAYHNNLLMYKGLKRPSELFNLEKTDLSLRQLIQGYGVGNWYRLNGQREKGFEIYDKMLTSDYWPSFGYLSAEVDLSRLRVKEKSKN